VRASGHADDLCRGFAAGFVAGGGGFGRGGEAGDGVHGAGERLGDDERGAELGDGAEALGHGAGAVGAGPVREVGEVATGAVGDVEEREGGVEEVFDELEFVVHGRMMRGGAGLARENRASSTIERAGVDIGCRFWLSRMLSVGLGKAEVAEAQGAAESGGGKAGGAGRRECIALDSTELGGAAHHCGMLWLVVALRGTVSRTCPEFPLRSGSCLLH
jgi:hypothetical protein